MGGDFADERDRMSNQTRRFNFRKAIWGPIRKYMNGRIKVIGSNVCREMVAAVGLRTIRKRNGYQNESIK